MKKIEARHPHRLFIPAFAIASLLLSSLTPAVAELPDDTKVYWDGVKRGHVEGCRRLTKDPAELAKIPITTLGKLKAAGSELCSRCPGSTTPGRDKGLESWVKPGPKKIEKHEFTTNPRAPLVSMGANGRIVYKPYTDKGDTLLDWSYTGYKRSEVPIPDVPAVVTLEPATGEAVPKANMAYPQGADRRQEIQAAIDQVATMGADTNGIRGAVLLKKGTYHVNGNLQVRSGVILRGEGDGLDGTVLIMNCTQTEQTAISIGEPGGKVDPVGEASSVRLTDAYVPSGSKQLNLADASQFKEGDFVFVRKTVNQQWIDDLGMGERLRHIRGGKEGMSKKPWVPKSYQFKHLRQIVAIKGNQVTIDAVLPQSFEKKHGGGDVYKVDTSSLGTHSGVEFLRVVSNYDTSVTENAKTTNFHNFESAIEVKAATDSWVRNVTVEHVSFAAVVTREDTRQITVRDTKCLKPVGPVRGGKRYAFNIAGGTLHLFYNCFSEDGRHDFAIGSRETGPFAFVNCTAIRGGQSEPHHRWSTGILYDNIITKDGTLAAINRGDSGSGHGWAAANTMFWNCDAKSIVVFDPETDGENNFAIGFRGTFDESTGTDALKYSNDRAGYWQTPQEGKYYGFALMGNGHIESPGAPVEPSSLYTQQLIDRIGKDKADHVLKQK